MYDFSEATYKIDCKKFASVFHSPFLKGDVVEYLCQYRNLIPPAVSPRLAFYSGNYNDFPSGFVCSFADVPFFALGCSTTSPLQRRTESEAGTGSSARGSVVGGGDAWRNGVARRGGGGRWRCLARRYCAGRCRWAVAMLGAAGLRGEVAVGGGDA